MRKEIDAIENANLILKGLRDGALITVKDNNKVNPMTISWGALGIDWRKQVFTAYVRENRYTKKPLDENGTFTINIPYGKYDKNIINFCGTNSGHDVDKVSALGLTLIDSIKIDVPAIKELPLTLECKVIYKQAQDPSQITKENKEKFHPQHRDSNFKGHNKDYHTAYYGEILKAYIIE